MAKFLKQSITFTEIKMASTKTKKKKQKQSPKAWLDVAFGSIAHKINKDVFKKDNLWPNVLETLASVKFKMLAAKHPNKKADRLLKSVLEPASLKDPYILTKKDIKLTFFGQEIKMKIDTGAKVSTLDARKIKWEKGKDYRKALQAYKLNSEKFPDRSTLLKEHLQDLPKKFHDLDFGVVSQYTLYTDKDEKNHILIKEPSPVIGISWPKNSSGKKEVPRPFISLPVSGNDLIKTLDVALVARETLSRRGLFGIREIKNYGFALVSDKRDTTIIDFSKIDPKKLAEVLKLVA